MIDHKGQVTPKVPVKVFHIACAAVEGSYTDTFLSDLHESVKIKAIKSTKGSMDPRILAKNWNIGLQAAEPTL